MVSRRRFLVSGIGGMAAAPLILPSGLLRAQSPSARLGAAVIGVGSRGSGHCQAAVQLRQFQLLAVCDVFRSKAEKVRDWVENAYAEERKTGAYKGCMVTQDFREVLARPDIDVVFIATPEHWHGVQMAMAAKAGKDVYGEKSLTHTVREGRALVDTVRRHGCVFQAGTQQRSDPKFRQACELARNGCLGEVRQVHVGVPGGRGAAAAGVWPVEAPPADLDYELWLGPSQWVPYRRGMCSYQWYFVSHFCRGWLPSWGVHHLDIALWGMPELGRGRVEIEGTAEYFQGTADVAFAWDITVTSASGLQLRFVDDAKSPGHGCRFTGSEGWVHVDRGRIQASDPALLERHPGPGAIRLQESTHHHADFAQAVLSRRDPVAPVEACHRATTLTLVADIAARLGRRLTWDWETECFPGDETASRMLGRALRSPWAVY
ncbi:MAG: Gfo/Idh/MocA family oxidoreductase [Lentisphaeria bacterium]|nr:Gfo/Idh/MocA family oxidoreductase [Lentisphaeria bacterium]